MRGVVTNTRAVALILGGLVLLGLALLALPEAEVVSLTSDVGASRTVSREAPLVLEFRHPTVQPKLRLTLRSSAPLAIEEARGSYAMEPGFRVNGNAQSYKCDRTADGEYLTRVLVSPPGERSRVLLYPESGSARAELSSWDVIKYKHNTTLGTLSPQTARWLLWAVVGVLVLAALLHARQRAVAQWLCIALSVGFVFVNEWFFCLVLVAFMTGAWLLRRRVNNGRSSVARLFCFIGGAVLFLCVFKYGKGFLFHGLAGEGLISLLLPVGVSYFVIRLIDTLLRWFRGQNLDCGYREFLFYMFFPGTLIAGPIEGLQEFHDRSLDRIGAEDAAYGVGRILVGLFKKIVIADAVLYPAILGERLTRLLWFNSGGSVNRLILDPAGAPPEQILMFGLAGVLFAYIDFSAYSDMAIGFSRLLGYRVRENFNFPILATNLREYWKRWHMSLSEWSFRNAYFPLLIKSRNPYVPLYVTMMIIGIWHAPSLSWYSWALHHATGMTLVALVQKHVRLPRLLDACLAPLKVGVTMSFVGMGFVFVYFNNYALAFQLYTRFWAWCLTLGRYAG